MAANPEPLTPEEENAELRQEVRRLHTTVLELHRKIALLELRLAALQSQAQSRP